MFSSTEIDMVNQELAEMAEEAVQAAIDSAYDAFYEDMAAEHDMQMYACHSYDNDAIHYGEVY